MTDNLALAKIKELVREAGSQAEVAEGLGISRSYLNDILQERREISGEIAAKLGFERQIIYLPTIVGISNLPGPEGADRPTLVKVTK